MKLVAYGIDQQEAFVLIFQMTHGLEVYLIGNLEILTILLLASLEGTHLEELSQELDFHQF